MTTKGMAMETVIVKRGINQQQATAAMTVAVLQVQLQDTQARLKAARDAAKQDRERHAEWRELDAARAELENATREQRAHIADLAKRWRAALEKTEAGDLIAADTERCRELRSRLKAATTEHRQMLMPFAEG